MAKALLHPATLCRLPGCFANICPYASRCVPFNGVSMQRALLCRNMRTKPLSLRRLLLCAIIFLFAQAARFLQRKELLKPVFPHKHIRRFSGVRPVDGEKSPPWLLTFTTLRAASGLFVRRINQVFAAFTEADALVNQGQIGASAQQYGVGLAPHRQPEGVFGSEQIRQTLPQLANMPFPGRMGSKMRTNPKWR